MSESFGIPQLTEYLTRMDLKLARVDEEKELIEIAFHGKQGQWRIVVGIQQSGDVRKLMLVVPHFGTLGTQKRQECLEALMAANYRIALGKFGLDLKDNEVRLEETIPLANNMMTFEQFQLAFAAMMQTVSLYRNLLPRIVYGDCSPYDALHKCEQDFFQDIQQNGSMLPAAQQVESTEPTPSITSMTSRESDLPELDVDEVLAEVVRMFEERKDR